MNKIEAIKIVRLVSNLGLKESKELVESIAPMLQMSQNDIRDRVDSINVRLQTYLNTDATYMTPDEFSQMTRLFNERESLKNLLCNKFHESEG